MIHYEKNEEHFFEFDSVGDLLDYVEDADPRGTSHNADSYYMKFNGGVTWEEAFEAARLGNTKLTKKLFEGIETLKSEISAARPVEVRDVSGEYFDVSEAIQGEPECFRRIEEGGGGKPVIRISAEMTHAHYIKARSIVNRGVAIVALCDELVNQGYKVELSCDSGYRNDYSTPFKKPLNVRVNVQLDPLDLDAVGTVFATATFYRRFIEAVIEKAFDVRDIGTGGPIIQHYEARQLRRCYEKRPPSFRFGPIFKKAGSDNTSEQNYSSLAAAAQQVRGMLQNFREGWYDANGVING